MTYYTCYTIDSNESYLCCPTMIAVSRLIIILPFCILSTVPTSNTIFEILYTSYLLYYTCYNLEGTTSWLDKPFMIALEAAMIVGPSSQ